MIPLNAGPGDEADEALADELERQGVAEFVRRWLAQPLFAGLATEAAGVEARLENTVAGLAASLRLAGTGAQESLWNRLPELEMPVLAVAGERDEIFRARAEAMVAAIGANAEAAVVPGAGHAAHSEAPEAFAGRRGPASWTEPAPRRRDADNLTGPTGRRRRPRRRRAAVDRSDRERRSGPVQSAPPSTGAHRWHGQR